MAAHLENIRAGLMNTIHENEGVDVERQIARSLYFLAKYVGSTLDNMEKDIARLEQERRGEIPR